jgi:plasmid stabilization system protein ParE
MTDALFTVSTPDMLDNDALFRSIHDNSYAVIRGLFSKEEMRHAVADIRHGFDAALDHPGMGDVPTDVMDNFQKLIIGTGAQTNYYVPRCLRILYNPLWADDRYGMHGIFRRLAEVRNHIQGHRPNYAVDGIEDTLWTAARLQHYPAGGGFFAPHRDAISPTNTHEAGLLKFIQILLLVTQRGEDFEHGGAYIDHHEQRIDLETTYGSGDILVYDGRSMHGVSDIDPHKLFDRQQMTGRITALVTLYTDMSGDDARYAHYRTRHYKAEP